MHSSSNSPITIAAPFCALHSNHISTHLLISPGVVGYPVLFIRITNYVGGCFYKYIPIPLNFFTIACYVIAICLARGEIFTLTEKFWVNLYL